MIENKYSTDLSRYEFDKSECIGCSEQKGNTSGRKRKSQSNGLTKSEESPKGKLIATTYQSRSNSFHVFFFEYWKYWENVCI
jgi:hypothetical protein